jgi:sec-independent protein translocase protein TatC
VPIVVVLLVKMNMVTVQKLKEFRGYFIVVAFVIAAVVTPPDVISQLALAVPMCLLYELGIWGSQWFIKSTAKADEEAKEEEAASS